MTSDPGTFLVDANLLIYAVDVNEATKQDRAIDVLGRLYSSGRGVLTVQTLGEFYNAARRRIETPLSDEQAEGAAIRYLHTWRVLSLTPDTQIEAMRCVREHQLSYWDSLVWASAKLGNVGTILTEDMQDGRVIEGVRIVNPLTPAFDLAVLD